MKAWQLYMVLLFCCQRSYSQQFPNIQFNYLTEKEGLSSNTVTSIAQDKEGFIWVGTGDGLNRLDGYRVKRFYHNPASENSLINNGIHQIVSDEKDRLWVSTREGLSVYDKKIGTFKNFRHNPVDTSSLDNDQYTDVYMGKDNSAWLTTSMSVYRFDSSLHYKKFFTGIKNLEDYEKIKIEAYQSLIADREGNLWAIKREFVFKIDKNTMRVTKIFGPFAGSLETIYQDSQSEFWLGSFGGGLIHFDPRSGRSFTVNLPSKSMVIHSLTEWCDRRHNHWLIVGSDNGLFIVDPISLRSKEYTFQPDYSGGKAPSTNVVQSVFVDRQNILWIGTEGGVFYVRPSQQFFDLWNIANPDVTAVVGRDWIYSLCELTDGYWMTRWIGPGLFHFDKNGLLTETVSSIRAGNKILSLADSLKPYYITNQGDSVLWFTTNEFLVHYDLRSKKALVYKPGDATTSTGLRTITIVNSHTWWIRTRNNGPNGIYIFDGVTRRFLKHFANSDNCNNCVPPALLTIYLSRKDLYISARGEGLFKYDPQTDHFISLFRFQGKELEKHSNTFNAISEDNNGVLWIASSTGVFAFDPKEKKIVRDYTNDELLGGVEVYGIILDEQENAWLDTERGIFYITHATGQSHKLTITAGLKNNSNGTFKKGNDQSIYSCIQGYVIRIHPSEILHQIHQKVSVHFSDATIMDTPYFFHYTSAARKEMIARPSQKRFSLDFSVMNYDGNNQYYYKLDGAMDNWQQNESGHLSFYNLSPGRYILRVKGSSQFNDLSGSEDDVTIIVKPYWWQTNGFKLSCLSFIIAMTTFLIRRRIVHIRQEASFKQKIAETEMMALRSQMNPHFIFNSLNSIENFMMQNEKRLASSYLNKFARLIRMILDSSRNELVPLTKDMEALRLYVDLEQLRFNQKFCFKLFVDPLLLNGDYKVPALLIQPYVENAIVHGLAHSERDDLSLTVSAKLEDEYIHYCIEDNGIGRQLSFQYNKQNKPHHKSVGLAITEERINIFNRKQNANGRVTIADLFDKNKEPSGTRVDILIKAV